MCRFKEREQGAVNCYRRLGRSSPCSPTNFERAWDLSKASRRELSRLSLSRFRLKWWGCLQLCCHLMTYRLKPNCHIVTFPGNPWDRITVVGPALKSELPASSVQLNLIFLLSARLLTFPYSSGGHWLAFFGQLNRFPFGTGARANF